MKLTKSKLQEIIKEELKNILRKKTVLEGVDPASVFINRIQGLSADDRRGMSTGEIQRVFNQAFDISRKEPKMKNALEPAIQQFAAAWDDTAMEELGVKDLYRDTMKSLGRDMESKRSQEEWRMGRKPVSRYDERRKK